MGYFCEDINSYRDYLLLNEAYIGKTPILKEIEEKLSIARKKVKYFGSNNNTIPEILEINRLFEKQFGMNLFSLEIEPEDYPNSSTYLLSLRYDIATNYVMHNLITGDSVKGYRFKKGNKFLIQVSITTGLMMDQRYTDAEIVGVLLHEIGHNFADCIYDKIEIYNREGIELYKKMLVQKAALLGKLRFIVWIPIIHGKINAEYKEAVKLLKKLDHEYTYNKVKKAQNSKQSKLKGLFKGLIGKKNDLKWTIDSIIDRLDGGAKYKEIKKDLRDDGTDTYMRSFEDRQNEVFADKFAAVYGYGVENAIFDTKSEHTPTKAQSIMNNLGGIFKKISDQYDQEILDFYDFDVHPQFMQRINSSIHLLKSELKKDDLDPKVKEAIIEQIDQLEKIIEENITITKEMSNNEKVKALYNKRIMEEQPDAIEKELEDAIESALDDALNKK